MTTLSHSPAGGRISAGWWAGRRVLVTGHTGFKGAWLVALLDRLGAEVTGLALAPTDDLGACARLSTTRHCASHLGDIRDRSAVRDAIRASSPQVVLHLAAQALVGDSLTDPVSTFDVNVMGTAVVLDESLASGCVDAVLVVTTDKVYANPEHGRPFREDDELGGGDPYSASKAGTELVARTWRDNFAGPDAPAIVTARAGNVIGGGDTSPDRLLPDVFRALGDGRPVEIRHPAAVRPWQHVLEPLVGYLEYAAAALDAPDATPTSLNFGPRTEDCVPVGEVVERVLQIWGDGAWSASPAPVEQREAGLLRLDASRAGETIGWRPVLDLDTALRWTTEWYRPGVDHRALADDQISRYLELAGVVPTLTAPGR